VFGFLARNRKQPSGGATSPIPPADLMRKVRRIEISTKRLVDEGVAGGYHSVFKGRGVEFAEVRPYQPGDDVRSIDWNVTARMGVPFVKQFVEERDLTVFLVIDISGSLSFGSRAILKRELAAEIAALLSFAALRNQDRVGAALVSDRLELFLPPRRRRSHVLRLVREVLVRRSEGVTDLDHAVAATLRNLKQRAVFFLISDFVETPYEAALKRAATRHDLVVVDISDPRDFQFPVTGPVLLRDAETGEAGVVDPRRLSEKFRKRREQRHRDVESLARRVGGDFIHLLTDRPYMPELVAFFEARRRRLQR
jgi:uncharacterized protein (DUF58 family)